MSFIMFIMTYTIHVYVTYDEYEWDPDSWILYPGDDFVPAEYNTVCVCDQYQSGVTWDTAMAVADSYATCPGDVDIDIKPD